MPQSTHIQSSVNKKEKKMNTGEAISRLRQVCVHNKTVRLDKATNALTVTREKLITVMIILMLPLFAEHLYFPEYIL